MTRFSLALVCALIAGPAVAEERPDARPPDAAKTETPSSSVGTAAKTPNTAYPDAPASTPSTGGANGARPPTPDETKGK